MISPNLSTLSVFEAQRPDRYWLFFGAQSDQSYGVVIPDTGGCGWANDRRCQGTVHTHSIFGTCQMRLWLRIVFVQRDSSSQGFCGTLSQSLLLVSLEVRRQNAHRAILKSSLALISHSSKCSSLCISFIHSDGFSALSSCE